MVGFSLIDQAQAATPDWQSESSRDFTLSHESDGLADAKVQLPQSFSWREMTLFAAIMAGSAAGLILSGRQKNRGW